MTLGLYDTLCFYLALICKCVPRLVRRERKGETSALSASAAANVQKSCLLPGIAKDEVREERESSGCISVLAFAVATNSVSDSL